MTNKEIAQRLRGIELTGDRGSITDLANELDPPRPDLGKVVWWRFIGQDDWQIGTVSVQGFIRPVGSWDYGVAAYEEIEWKPARILAPDEVEIHRKTAQAILGEYSYHNIGIGTVFATDARDDLREAILARAALQEVSDESHKSSSYINK